MTRGLSDVEAMGRNGDEMTKIEELARHGQALWYDFIRRDMLTGSGLEDLVRPLPDLAIHHLAPSARTGRWNQRA